MSAALWLEDAPWRRSVVGAPCLDGQDGTGRLYASFDRERRKWLLLLGWKAEQPREIAWLRQRS